jgi:hypothetical protein
VYQDIVPYPGIPEINFYNIYDFPVYSVEIDFNKPKFSSDQMVKITEEVEKSCPVATILLDKEEGNVGEGVVWSTIYRGDTIRFKVKGEKHSSSKVKKLAKVDVEKLKSIEEFVNYAVTPNRVKQAIQETSAESIKQTGNVVRWVANDIIAEESDTLESNSLIWKDVASACSKRAARIFHQYLQ